MRFKTGSRSKRSPWSPPKTWSRSSRGRSSTRGAGRRRGHAFRGDPAVAPDGREPRAAADQVARGGRLKRASRFFSDETTTLRVTASLVREARKKGVDERKAPRGGRGGSTLGRGRGRRAPSSGSKSDEAPWRDPRGATRGRDTIALEETLRATSLASGVGCEKAQQGERLERFFTASLVSPGRRRATCGRRTRRARACASPAPAAVGRGGVQPRRACVRHARLGRLGAPVLAPSAARRSPPRMWAPAPPAC